MLLYIFIASVLGSITEIVTQPYEQPTENDINLHAILPPNTKGFEAFYPRDAYGIPNGSSRPAHGHGSFYQFRNPALVDTKNSPAYGYRFDGGRRFNFD
ncbi:hypothetical protein PGB90_009594 [Kerria lacca]